METPWTTSVDAVAITRILLQQHWVCQRIVETLEAHLVEQHVVLKGI